MSATRLFTSEWYDGMRALAEREWSASDAQAVVDGAGAPQLAKAWDAARAADFAAAAVPAEHGGAGLGLAGALDVVAAGGAKLFPAALAFDAVLPALILRRAPRSSRTDELLGELAAGARVAVALSDGRGLDGGAERACFVHGLESASHCLVVHREAGTVSCVEPASLAGGTPLHVLDGREIAAVAVPEQKGAVLADGATGSAVAAQARSLALLVAVADSLGAAEAALERGIEYACQRRQFGAPIGAFQAVKHALVDRYVELQVARALLASASGAEDVDPIAAAMAKAQANVAAVASVNTAIQVHGAVGFTQELGLHLHLRRVLTDRELFAGTGSCLAAVRASLGLSHVPDLQPEPAGAAS